MFQKSTAGFLAEAVFIQNFFFLNFWSIIGLGCISDNFRRFLRKSGIWTCLSLSVYACTSDQEMFRTPLEPISLSEVFSNGTKYTQNHFFDRMPPSKKVVFDRMPPPVSSRYYRLHTLVFFISSDWKLKKWNHNIFVNRKL